MNTQPDLFSPTLSKKDRKMRRREEKRVFSEKFTQQRTLKRLSLWTLVAFILAGVVFGLVKVGGSNPSFETASILTTAVAADDWVKGSPTASLILIEYSDFQCPSCALYSGIIKAMLSKYSDKVRFVYRHFPLKNKHKNAELAARASEAAGKQEKFWEMHDIIFIKQNDWAEKSDARSLFTQYAETLQLDKEQFAKDLDSPAVKGKVETDYRSAMKNNLPGTPSFFANGRRIEFPPNREAMEKLIQVLLAEGNS